MNIFDVIRSTTSRTEPFHTRFLAEALNHSLGTDRRLFDAVWRLGCGDDSNWPVPAAATVLAEDDLSDRSRVDIVIRDLHSRHLLGIEGKTVDLSVEPGQLARYRGGLVEKYPDTHVRIVFLTPYNRSRAGEYAASLASVMEYERYRAVDHTATHLSWLDIADVEWDGGDVWAQHRSYVRQTMCRSETLRAASDAKDRGLSHFLGEEVVARFWEVLAGHGINVIDGRIDLQSVRHPSHLIEAVTCLLDSEEIDQYATRADSYPPESRDRMLMSGAGHIHEGLFQLVADRPNLWLRGTVDYGLRVAHFRHPGGVSLATSRGTGVLEVGRRR